MPGELSSYEQQRLKNIEENRRVLAELGLFKAFVAPPRKKAVKKAIKRKRPVPPPALPDDDGPDVAVKECLDAGSDYGGGRRRSRRIKGQVPVEGTLVDSADSPADEDYRPAKKVPRPNVFGAIPGIEVGTTWDMRMECSADGVHRPTVAGIHGGEEGCYSLALSGGYEDDLDFGEYFTYTGEGGRDLKGTKNKPKNLRTAPQSKDQTLMRGNLALSRSAENGNPVRVIRGYKLDSVYAPEEGYRYDGLYTVERYWFTTGLSGFGVYKFALKRCPDQAPPPWGDVNGDESNELMEEDASSDSGFSERNKEPKEEDASSDIGFSERSKESKEEDASSDSGFSERSKESKEEDASSDSGFSERSKGSKEEDASSDSGFSERSKKSKEEDASSDSGLSERSDPAQE